MDHSIEMGQWPGLFQWVRTRQGGSIQNKERGTVLWRGGGSGGTGLLKRWEWRISDFSTCLEGDPDGEDVWPVVSDKSGRWISRFHHIVQPPTPPLEFSNRFTLRASWPPVSPDSKGEHVFAESDSGEGEFIVFPLDFWEVRVERGLGINTGFTEKSKSRPPPPSSPHMP